MADVWAQTLNMRWAPSLRFYEQRISLLRTLEDQRVLRAFAVDENGPIGAQVLTPGHQITLRHDGLTISVLGANADIQETVGLARTMTTSLAITAVHSAQCRFQYIHPLPLTFDQAVSAGNQSVARMPAADDFQVSDWSMLVDLKAGDDRSGQIETGIIRAHEAASRLHGRIGRLGQSGLPLNDIPNTAYPDVALFADITWEPGSQHAGEKFENVEELWSDRKRLGDGLVDRLHGQILDQATNLGYIEGER